jgi:exopolyphosphatase / guanosine-5'-triphosphate,3'-diphosphate pyrophosphatase
VSASRAIAIIDIGSNSIKVLVATRAADGTIQPLHVRTIDARISAGISRREPELGDEGMARGLAAIQSLLAETAAFFPARTILVATSAVRDARNGAEFRERVREATGHEIRILSGPEEANLIGRGLTCDPALRGLADFYVFDLGGGSLECLAFCQRRVVQVASLQLGCVRLTENFVADPAQPVAPESAAAIASHVHDVLAGSFRFVLPRDAAVIGTGGTVATARAMLAATAGITFEQSPVRVSVGELRELLARIGPLPLDRRRQVPGLPPPRADIFPVALATLIAVAEAGGFPAYHYSAYNLRYGLADEALAPAG